MLYPANTISFPLIISFSFLLYFITQKIDPKLELTNKFLVESIEHIDIIYSFLLLISNSSSLSIIIFFK